MKKIIAFAVFSLLLFVVSCSPTEIKPSFALEPSVYAEAEVVSLKLDEQIDEGNCGACPSDRTIILIVGLDRTDDPRGLVNLKEGEVIDVDFRYSARPAKLRNDIMPECEAGNVLKDGSCYPEKGPYLNDTAVSSPLYPQRKAEIEDNFIVYHLPKYKDAPDEIVLNGLKEGNKIKIRIWQSEIELYQAPSGEMRKRIEVETYEIMG